MSVNDVLLRMNHVINATEQGRKVMSTFASTGKLVAETGSRFKTGFTSWMKGSGASQSSLSAAANNTDTADGKMDESNQREDTAEGTI